jgi:hypothetical protein
VAISRWKTKYPKRLFPVLILLLGTVELSLHKFFHSIYDIRQVSDDLTIIDEKYITHELYCATLPKFFGTG